MIRNNRFFSFRYIAVICGLVLLTSPIVGQRLVRARSNGSLDVSTINKHIKDLKLEGSTPATEPVDLRKVSYTSTDENGKQVELTGMLAIPRSGAPKGIVVFMHGTTWDRRNSPSRLTSKGAKNEAMTAASVFAPAGFAVVMPDYLGLGDHKAIHPYPLNRVNARSGADMLPASREALRRINYRVGTDLFVTGYSEGGGTAMGLVQLLEKEGKERPKAAAPASGPYDLTGATRDFLIAEAKGKDIIARAYLLGYCVEYFESRGIKASDYFTRTMAKTVDDAFKDGRSEESILLRLAIMSTLSGATRSIEHLLTPRFIGALERLDLSDPIISELTKNNVHDWSPSTPMLLIYLNTDKIVDPLNSENTYDAMRTRGIGPGRLERFVIMDDKLDHLSAFPPAMIAARLFFEYGFEGVK
jgi:acetyl esterase/lipase